ncbi:hypothetical protein [Desulfocicer niacini]
MMLTRVIFLLVFLAWTNALAEPAIDNMSGSFTSGDTATITGSQFGSHDLKIEWRGNEIEAGQAGTILTSQGRWYYERQPNSSWAAPVYSTAHAHSGKQSLEVDLTSKWQGALRYDSGTGVAPDSSLFVSWWVYLSDMVGDGQWKMFRINWQNDIQDDYPQMVMFNWYNANQLIVRPGPETSSNTKYVYPSYPDVSGKWYRMDVIIKESSLGRDNGSLSTFTHDPESRMAVKRSTLSNIMTYHSGDRRHRWFLWQNYVGNGMNSLKVFLDDIYIQTGTQARVEIGDDDNWADCTWREIQVPTSWTDNSISFQVNSGAFTDGQTAYLFVVDSDGNPSAGQPITIGSGSRSPALPTPPTNLKIQ